jgi:hypothetical protein
MPYVPNGSKPLSELSVDLQIRLLLQGPPFNGKTHAAMTFPNPVVLDFDQKLGAFAGRSDIIQVPFYDGEFCDKIVRRDGTQAPPNKKDALLKWLKVEGPKLERGQTLVLDSSTAIENAFHVQYSLNPTLTKKGDIDGFAEWRQKNDYFGEMMGDLKALKCHVIYICHEQIERDDEGKATGRIRNLMSGAYGDKLASNFTDYFRVLPYKKPINPEQLLKFKEYFKLNEEDTKEWLNFGTDSTLWVFQTQPDEKANCGSLSVMPKYILADYKHLVKYRNKQTTK